jgi:hypothetical protein
MIDLEYLGNCLKNLKSREEFKYFFDEFLFKEELLFLTKQEVLVSEEYKPAIRAKISAIVYLEEYLNSFSE